MRTFRLNDGLILSAETSKGFLEELRHKSHTKTATLDEFCDELARRIEEQTGYIPPSTEHDVLLEALLLTGLVTEIDPIGDSK